MSPPATSAREAARHPPITVDVLRGPAVESRHVVYGLLWGDADGAAADAPAGQVLASWGDPGLLTFLRSALKPIQVLPLLVDGFAADLGVTDEEIALATGSHSGQQAHLDVLHGLMERTSVTPSMLRCGRHRPFHKDSARAVGDGFTSEHNNCSGKHAAMLAWCVAKGVDPEGYLSPDHPLQERILDYVSLLCGLPRREIGIGVDGCGVPTFATPLGAMARLFLMLADPQRVLRTREGAAFDADAGRRLVAALEWVRAAMQRHPFMVAGDERADTDTIAATGGRVVTKAGAEGLWCGVDTEQHRAFAFKAVDGHFRATVPAALEVAGAERILDGAALAALERHHRPKVKNHLGTVVGEIVPRLP